MKEKIILGTVQLGLPYGINNKEGKPTEEEAFKILDFAFDNGITSLDTADGYGEALEVIGRYKAYSKRSFRIINKFKIDETPLFDKLNKSLDLLQVPSLFCYMYHHFPDYDSGRAIQDLRELKRNGRIKKIGISLYNVDQLSKVVDDGDIDIIQIPVNILDLSKEKEELLMKAKENGREIHARSVYLQGLFLKSIASLIGNLTGMKPYLEKINLTSLNHNIDLKKAALNFVLQKKCVDHVVLGIDHVSQLKENLALIDPSFNEHIFDGIEVDSGDAYLLNPANWKP
jgi:aryl-alcohol dehydrogenase-like predicted oxidoreductase